MELLETNVDHSSTSAVSEICEMVAGREVVIEAGHFYLKTLPTELQLKQIKATSSLAVEIGNITDPKFVVFVDEYNVLEGLTTAHDHRIVASECWNKLHPGFAENVDFVYLESLMMTRASAILSKLSSKGKIVDNGYVCVLKSDLIDPQGITMVRYVDGQGIPTCTLLDAACYTLKGEMYPEAIHITILPKDYSDQQRKTKKVLEIIGDKTEILNLYLE